MLGTIHYEISQNLIRIETNAARASNHQVDRTPKSQFADDTTLIIEDFTSFRNATSIVNLFGVMFGFQLNKRKQKPCGLVLRANTKQNL